MPNPSALDRVVLAGRIGSVGGLARVLRELAPRLAMRGMDIHVHSFDAGARDADGVTVHAGRPGGFGDEERIALLCRKLAAGSLVVIDTYERICDLVALIRTHLSASCQVFAYMPFDGQLVDPAPLTNLGPEVKLVLYTKCALATLRMSVHRANLDVRQLPQEIHVIGHGVSDQFKPFERRAQARQRLFPRDESIADAFVVLNANRNQTRKRIDLTLRGFKRFVTHNSGNIRLLLHMERKAAYDLVKEAANLGIRERLLLTTQDTTQDTARHPGVADDVLNDVYNAADVGLNTSLAEGWGLVAFEHALTGAAQVMTDSEVVRELWQGAADFLTVEREVQYSRSFVGNVTAPEHVGDALTRLYTDRSHLGRMRANAAANAARPELSWERVTDRWIETIHGGGQPSRPA